MFSNIFSNAVDAAWIGLCVGLAIVIGVRVIKYLFVQIPNEENKKENKSNNLDTEKE